MVEASATESAVSCRRVTKSFGEGESRTLALRGVDLDVKRGELTFLVGPSGCGKTTLLSVIAGLLDPSEGEVRLFGEDVGRLADRERTRFRLANVGFVFQQYNLLPALTAAENVAVPLLAAGRKRALAVGAAKDLLAQLGLAAKVDSLPSTLSGGQQQRVALARALVNSPRLLVCDEPTSALDARTGQAVLELIQQVAVEPTRAVIVVTHDSRVFSFADTVAHMDDGRIVAVEAGETATPAMPEGHR